MKSMIPLIITGFIGFKTAVFATPFAEGAAPADSGSEATHPSPGAVSADPPESQFNKTEEQEPEAGADTAPEGEREFPWASIFENSSFAEQISAARRSVERARQALEQKEREAASAVAVAFLTRGLVAEENNQAMKSLRTAKKAGGSKIKAGGKYIEAVNRAVAEVSSAELSARTAERAKDRLLVMEVALEAEVRSQEAHLAFLEARAVEESHEVPLEWKEHFREQAVLFKVLAVKAESDLKDLCQSSFDLEASSVKDVIGGF